jgi:hypothetical protein
MSSKTIDPHDFNKVREAFKIALEIMKPMVKRSCATCTNWDNGCKLANGDMPPQNVINNGCDSYKFDEIPF